MKFKDWLSQLEDQERKLEQIALMDIQESISVDGSLITVTLGKESFHATIDGKDFSPRQLRPFYTHHKEEFNGLLESLTEQADNVVQASSTILSAFTDRIVPGEVIARMEGEEAAGGPVSMAKKMCEPKLVELLKTISNCGHPLGKFSSFEAKYKVGGRLFQINFGYGIFTIRFGDLQASQRYTSPVLDMDGNLEDMMFFVGNYEIIKQRLVDFLKRVKAL